MAKCRNCGHEHRYTIRHVRPQRYPPIQLFTAAGLDAPRGLLPDAIYGMGGYAGDDVLAEALG